jgi:hypothetical protein
MIAKGSCFRAPVSSISSIRRVYRSDETELARFAQAEDLTGEVRASSSLGNYNCHLPASLAESHSRFAMLIKVSSKDMEAVTPACSQTARYPATHTDLGSWAEMAKDKTFTLATDVKVYFCDRL